MFRNNSILSLLHLGSRIYWSISLTVVIVLSTHSTVICICFGRDNYVSKHSQKSKWYTGTHCTCAICFWPLCNHCNGTCVEKTWHEKWSTVREDEWHTCALITAAGAKARLIIFKALWKHIHVHVWTSYHNITIHKKRILLLHGSSGNSSASRYFI